jgi:hypothetical protein
VRSRARWGVIGRPMAVVVVAVGVAVAVDAPFSVVCVGGSLCVCVCVSALSSRLAVCMHACARVYMCVRMCVCVPTSCLTAALAAPLSVVTVISANMAAVVCLYAFVCGGYFICERRGRRGCKVGDGVCVCVCVPCFTTRLDVPVRP